MSAYLLGVIAIFAWCAYLDVHEVREAFWLGVFWPLVIVVLAIGFITDLVLGAAGWRANLAGSDGRWGIRHPDDGWPGVALRCPWFEVMFWKRRP